MKKIIALGILAVLLVTLCSCKSNTEDPPGNNSGGTAGPPTTSPTPLGTGNLQYTTLFADDDLEILRVIDAGKLFVAKLQIGEQPENARDLTMENAALAFERFFVPDTLRISGVFIDPNETGSYTFIVSGLDENNYARSVKVYFREGEPMTWYCPMVYYSAMIDSVVGDYLGFLRNNNSYNLASWLLENQVTPDESYVREVSMTMDYLNRNYELAGAFIREDETRIIETGLYSTEGFIVTVEDAGGNTFQIELNCGDGLIYPTLHQGWLSEDSADAEQYLPSHGVRSVSINYGGNAVVDFTTNVGDTTPLTVRAEPVGSGNEIIWTSSNNSIFEVTATSATGTRATVTAKSRGSAYLTVSVDGIMAECIVRVR